MAALDYDSLFQVLQRRTGPSRWSRVSQADIQAFADLTGDHNYLHVDSEKAVEGPFGKTIAHGFLTLSLLGEFWTDLQRRAPLVATELNYGFDKIRFLGPVPSDSEIRGVFKLKGLVKKNDIFIATMNVEVECQQTEKSVIFAEWLLGFSANPRSQSASN